MPEEERNSISICDDHNKKNISRTPPEMNDGVLVRGGDDEDEAGGRRIMITQQDHAAVALVVGVLLEFEF